MSHHYLIAFYFAFCKAILIKLMELREISDNLSESNVY